MSEQGRVPVQTPHGSYAVLIGSGVLDDLAPTVQREAPAHRYALIADDTVASLYAEQVSRALSAIGRVDLFTFPAGESRKSRETWGD
ncbi:MAG: 3-dehydroquinate synthase, partial [Gemmatimonadetes bacterium]|nr:3-dehydroquinate synthase [Gemmatimonadota bacterium]